MNTTTTTTVGVVGAGVMGASLAHALTARGIDTVLQDTDPAALDEAMHRIAAAGRLARLTGAAGPGRPGPARQARLTGELTELAGCDLVIENVTEDPAVKRSVHQRLDAVLPATAVVAVNTSAVPISDLALATGHPERVIGAHFMNPVATSTMVEVVRTPYVAQWALDRLLEILGQFGKESVVVADAAGFVINRCLMIFINEAAALLDDGVATPQQVDRLFRGCLGHRTGPLRTADIIGLDTVVRTLDVLRDQYGPERFTPSDRLLRMVAAGQHGRKTGQGFYSYTTDGAAA
ncbi:3-hydroxyacyl-CoA dehydrogenase family protein [Dactylosporangium sp. NPDC050688]|uniref:3-hydroxyacyl-CoA dehydrogenase family protein n=1 Tax=Dactylosporangium sp. NPDC050688 TaxID=3157217 RepID=UPI0033E549CA